MQGRKCAFPSSLYQVWMLRQGRKMVERETPEAFLKKAGEDACSNSTVVHSHKQSLANLSEFPICLCYRRDAPAVSTGGSFKQVRSFLLLTCYFLLYGHPLVPAKLTQVVHIGFSIFDICIILSVCRQPFAPATWMLAAGASLFCHYSKHTFAPYNILSIMAG